MKNEGCIGFQVSSRQAASCYGTWRESGKEVVDLSYHEILRAGAARRSGTPSRPVNTGSTGRGTGQHIPAALLPAPYVLIRGGSAPPPTSRRHWDTTNFMNPAIRRCGVKYAEKREVEIALEPKLCLCLVRSVEQGGEPLSGHIRQVVVVVVVVMVVGLADVYVAGGLLHAAAT
ncbi:hypothetical protein E2C01_045842 [Portunus trituberculatus]|uniref:Uncharacterized protein n=1 Tax=Portunus trituberculatus TaxID=210409 RepID=A0A5B7G3F7_PORTR|nr:hypothetical protein [Portunus trituberculatus]